MPAEDIRYYVDNGDDAYNTRFQASMSVGVGESKDIGVMVDATDKAQGEDFGLSSDDDLIIHAVAPNSQAPEEAADGPGGSSGQ